ncbi:MAG: hypothetical protein RSB69_10645 [Odoribacter sp.]
MKNRLFLGFAVVMMIVATSCGKMPQEKMDATKVAVESAQAAQADIYMAPEFKALQDSLASVMQSIEAENSNFFKNFDAQSAQLDALKAQAESVAAAVPAKKEAVKQEAETVMASVKTAIDETKALLAKAPKGKEGKAALEQIGNELNVVTTTVGEVEASMAGDVNFVQVLDRLNAAQKSVSDLNAELTEAIAKKAGKK